MNTVEDMSIATVSPPDIRLVIFHKPGSTWDPELSAIDQAGIMAHQEYLKAAAEQGVVQLGGPFLGANEGGMMITRAGIAADEILDLCRNDPAVQSGLIEFEIRSWMLTISIFSAPAT